MVAQSAVSEMPDTVYDCLERVANELTASRGGG